MAADWTAPVDIYCERTSPELWSEPLNAVTNAAFLIAAVAAFALWRRHARTGDWPALALILVTAAVGIGSGLFHTVATRWAGLADVIPIGVFILGYLVLALRRFLKLGAVGTGLGLAGYVAASVAVPWLVKLVPGPWESSGGYFPALLAMAAIGGLAKAMPARATHDAGGAVLLAAGLFTLSLAFRSADRPLCGVLPAGTHFVWHLLNAAVLYVLLRAAILHRAAN
jgi:hypothetical protein